MLGASQVVLMAKNLPANTGDMRREFHPWARKIPWRRAWQPTPVFFFFFFFFSFFFFLFVVDFFIH